MAMVYLGPFHPAVPGSSPLPTPNPKILLKWTTKFCWKFLFQNESPSASTIHEGVEWGFSRFPGLATMPSMHFFGSSSDCLGWAVTWLLSESNLFEQASSCRQRTSCHPLRDPHSMASQHKTYKLPSYNLSVMRWNLWVDGCLVNRKTRVRS